MKRLLSVMGVIAILGAGCSGPNVPKQVETYGMTQYTDPTYGFTFWYPHDLKITSFKKEGDPFPGGTVVERLRVGQVDGATISVVDSPTGSITDEPAGHASPISQTKYFYDPASKRWMVAFPEDADRGSRYATTTVDVDASKKTIGGLTMLPTGLRFDATIIPLSTTRFLVISDGGTGTAPSLAYTVAPTSASVDASAQEAALKAEAAAYSNN